MSLGSRINDIRREKGISLDELCELSGIPKSTVSKITSGITTNPTLDTVKALARSLGCKLDDFDDPDSQQKISPDAGEPTQEDAARKLDVNEVINAFVASGLFGPDEDLTDEDLRFLISIIDAIRSWFAQKQKKGS